MTYYEKQLKAYIQKYVDIDKDGFAANGMIKHNVVSTALSMIKDDVFGGDLHTMKVEALNEYGVILPRIGNKN